MTYATDDTTHNFINPFVDYEWTDTGGEDHYMGVARHDNLVYREMRRIIKLTKKFAATGDEGMDFVNAIGDLLDLFRAEDRLPAMLPILEDTPSTLFWDAWGVVWPHCDKVWEFNDQLVALLRRHQRYSPARRHDSAEPLTIYRGCHGACVYGVSWTTNREVAEWFACGHHGLKMIDPVVASATISRRDVFDDDGCWDEDEVVVDPAALRDLKLTPYQRPDVIRHPLTGIEYKLTAEA